MSSPTDIPRFGAGSGGGIPGPPEPTNNSHSDAVGELDPEQVRHEALRAAIEVCAAEPGPDTVIDVLRHCLFGPLLLDVTGSEITLTDDGEIAAGSTIQVRGGEGPDGKPALFAFTSHEQIARMYEDGADTQSLVQPAADVLEMCRSQEAAWLYLDPAGPTCALAADDIAFALQVPRNDAVRAMLEPGHSKEELLAALLSEGPLSLGVDAIEEAPADAENDDDAGAQLHVRATDAPDGAGPALLAFTSGPEAVARATNAQIATQSAAEVLELVRDGGFAGLLLNPAGPWAYLSAADLAEVSS